MLFLTNRLRVSQLTFPQRMENFKHSDHRDWRWFDFLWMTNTMDYQRRDDFNTLLLRAFSLFSFRIDNYIQWIFTLVYKFTDP